MNDATLRLSGLTKTYLTGTPGEVQVLRGADLELRAGEAVALVAPSGAGKSTLLHIAGLLDSPDAGVVEIAGQDLKGKGDRTRTGNPTPGRRFRLPVPSLVARIHGVGEHRFAAVGQRRVRKSCQRSSDGFAGQGRRCRAGRSSSGRSFGWRTAAGGVLPSAGQQPALVAGG